MEKGNLFAELFDIIKRNLTLIGIVIIVAAISAYVFSGPAFMKPRFKSVAVVYPINIQPHSDESETEQMLQLFAHDAIKESVLNTFKLYERWNLNPDAAEYKYWSDLLYQERVSIGPTRYESVEIVTQDEDPEVAKAMAQLVLEMYNQVTRQGDRDVHLDYLKLKDFEISRLNMVIDSLESRVNTIRIESGITDFSSQSERVVEGYMSLVESGASQSKLDEVKEMMGDLSKAGSELEILQEKLEGLKEYNAELTQDRIMAESKANSNLRYSKLVVEPQAADKKIYPIRWIIMVLSILLGALAAIVFVILKERLFIKS